MSQATTHTSPDPGKGSDASRPAYTDALLRHFVDLRDGTHGGASSQRDKERLYTAAVALLDPHARRVLEKINGYLLRDTRGGAAPDGRRSTGGGPPPPPGPTRPG